MTLNPRPRRRPSASRRASRRNRRLMAAFAVLATGSLAVAGWRMSGDDPPPESAYTVLSVTAARSGTVSVAIAGDTMFGDGAQTLIDAGGSAATLSGVAGMLSAADAAVVNMEAPVTANATPLDPGAQYSYASPPEAADALAAIGVDVFQLGNNHTMDRGAAGLDDTIRIAADAGIATVGAGDDRAHAARPLLLRAGALTVALVSFGEDYGAIKRSDATAPGMVPFSVDAIMQAEQIARRAGADRVIALAHWGDNYADVNGAQRYWAGQLAAAGYDAVIGTGPHILQPVEVIDGVPVAFSIGNFVFGAPGRFASFGRPGYGMVATVSFDSGSSGSGSSGSGSSGSGSSGSGSSGSGDPGRGSLTLRCIVTDNAIVGYVPRECDPTEAAGAANIIMGGVQWQASVGTLRF